MKINEFISTANNSIKVDFLKIEEQLGFELHQNIKDFYSRANLKINKFEIKFKKSLFTETDNKKFDKWLIKGKLNDYRVIINLPLLPKKSESHYDFINSCFNKWTGGNDFGKRINIGEITTNMGQILILINNDNGNIEWLDCEYGYFDIYEENPHGIFSNTTQEFLEKLHKCSVNKEK